MGLMQWMRLVVFWFMMGVLYDDVMGDTLGIRLVRGRLASRGF